MRTGLDIADDADAQAAEDRPEVRAAEPPCLTTAEAATKSSALASLVADSEIRRLIGSAWPLYVMLVLDWGGTVNGTRDGIGKRMGESGRNVGNWMDALSKGEIVTVEKNGRRMTVTLAGDHMEAARMCGSPGRCVGCPQSA